MMTTEKPAEQDHKKIRRQARIRTIRLGEIRVSPNGQRELNNARVKKILDSLDMERLGTMTVSHRDGFYWLIDGQHRYHALKEFFGEGYEEWEVEAWCYFDLTEEQEAEKFLQHNEVLAVDAYSKFKVGVAAGRPIESDINRIVLSLGLKVTRQHGHGCITAVGALTNVYTKYGARSLVSTLFTLREAFGDYGYESTVIQGLALFGERYAGRVDERRLLEKLASKPKGVKGLINHAHLIREKVAQPVVPCIAAAITDTYNAGARGKGLGSFWKDHADTADAA